MKRGQIAAKTLNIIFVIFVFGFLLAGLARTLFFPKDVNYFENRSANKLTAPSVGSWLSGEYQEGVEEALNDQIPFAQSMKKSYYRVENEIKFKAMLYLSRRYPSTPVNFGKFIVFGGEYLAYPPAMRSNIYPRLDVKLELFNRTVKANPDVDFYMYYIERDYDLDFTTGERLEAYEYLRDRSEIPEENTGSFSVRSLEEFEEFFLKTDPHWNAVGAYRGYCEIVRLILGEDEPLLQPTGKTLVGNLSGSKAKIIGAEGLFCEDFYSYTFDDPDYTITIHGKEYGDYGMQKEFIAGSTDLPVTYGYFYGGDYGEIVFDTGNESASNVLILGESFDNAILKQLATHFNKTFSVDLRNYDGEFRFGEYVRKNGIDKVLFVGNLDFFHSDIFVWED